MSAVQDSFSLYFNSKIIDLSSNFYVTCLFHFCEKLKLADTQEWKDLFHFLLN